MLAPARLIIALAAIASPVAAQTTRFAPGTLTARVTARADSSESYALYIPSSYTAARRWPVLFLMEPRGNALLPLERFRAAAERFGYIVLSSYNTMSDGSAEPNVRALDAMLAEAQDHFAIDERRLYLAGFSGTARQAWQFAVDLRQHVAGVIGFGAGLPTPLLLVELARLGPSPVSFFGASGITDFNYEEVRALDALLDELPVRHHVEFFTGAHEWPPSETCTRALEWMELQAMRAGLRPRDPALVDSLHDAWLAAAVALEGEHAAEAWDAYQRVRDDYRELRDVSAAAAHAERLGRDRAVRRVVSERRELASRDSAYQETLVRYLRGVRAAREPPEPAAIERALDIERLERTAGDDDRLRAQAAQRMLERAFVFLAFYEPREYFESGEQPRAIALLTAARRIKPESPLVCFSLARAHSELGQQREALEALECAVRSSRVGAAQLAREPTLAGLRREPRFAEILDRLRKDGRPD